ncbi:AraC family transcriptional regulator [uncultured Duncaniella sp.]|uniref:helix-turn-helix domain-containing protein n=1 Tax=uncultured Duncaniella sp. TaxID=2768039 RepID=UPI0025F39CA5|nr:helix-turn-helix domain-containing protein [uncultured Duncaniella sp.]
MTQAELISIFPPQNSIVERILLIGPDLFRRLEGLAVHECRIFLLLTRGTATLSVGNETIRIHAGHFMDLLVWEPITFMAMSDDIAGWCILPNYEFTNEALNDMKPANSESFKNRHSVPRLTLNENEAAVIEAQLSLFRKCLNDTDHFYRSELCQTYFRSFMLEIGNLMLRKGQAEEESDGVVTRQDMIIMGFLKLVWKYYKEEHNIDFYAGRLCVSAKHLSRVVKDKLGKTPYAVIRDELVQQACFLLKDTTMSIQDISAELHFSEMAAFCKFFKKHNSVSPTMFRASAKKAHQSLLTNINQI